MLYSRRVETSNLASAKAPELNDCKSMHIANMDRLTIVQSRELSHGPNGTINGKIGKSVADEMVLKPGIPLPNWKTKIKRAGKSGPNKVNARSSTDP